MVKKATLIMIICMLIASVCVFVSCKEEPPAAPAAPGKGEPVVNKAGEASDNLLENGTFDENDDIEVREEDSTLLIVAGVGKEGSALSVSQNSNYASVMFDLTEYYGRGKSYYMEASFKNNNSPVTDDLTARISYSVLSGYVYEKYPNDYYDQDIVYSGEFLDAELAEELYEIDVNDEGESIEEGDWVTVCGIVPAEEIDRIIGDSTLKTLEVAFYVGTYSDDKEHGQKGYTYYLDNIVIKDLNSELKTTGATYKPAEDDDDDNGDE